MLALGSGQSEDVESMNIIIALYKEFNREVAGDAVVYV